MAVLGWLFKLNHSKWGVTIPFLTHTWIKVYWHLLKVSNQFAGIQLKKLVWYYNICLEKYWRFICSWWQWVSWKSLSIKHSRHVVITSTTYTYKHLYVYCIVWYCNRYDVIWYYSFLLLLIIFYYLFAHYGTCVRVFYLRTWPSWDCFFPHVFVKDVFNQDLFPRARWHSRTLRLRSRLRLRLRLATTVVVVVVAAVTKNRWHPVRFGQAMIQRVSCHAIPCHAIHCRHSLYIHE